MHGAGGIVSSRVPVAALVLAAGSGERYRSLCGQFKLLAPLSDGRPLVRATCELAVDVAARVIVVGRCDLSGVQRALAGVPAVLLACPAAAAGPGAALRAGVAAIPEDHAIMVFLADMPYIALATAVGVREALQHGAALVRPMYNGAPGHPVGFARDFRAELLQLDAQRGAAPLLSKHRDRLQRLCVDDPGCVHDIDEPDDILG